MSLLLDRHDPGAAVQCEQEPRMPAPSDVTFDRFASPAPGLPGLDFELPPSLEAAEPPEARGLRRDEVRLMVSHYRDNRLLHATFRDLPSFLEAGDAVVINTSGTLNAAVPVQRSDGTALELHLSTHLPAGLWVVELRRPDPETGTTGPMYEATAGETLTLPGNAEATLHVPYHAKAATGHMLSRLWVATLRLPGPVHDYLDIHGFPIRYGYVKQAWLPSFYQTVYATEMGSAEMPSAGRAFTPELLTQLVARGVLVVPIVLHTGVSSLEDHEPPYDEYYRVPAATARVVNDVRAAGRRVVAVGTTVVRALETVADDRGTVHPGHGWTDLVISPRRGLRVVDTLLTGLHEPRSSHLAMLEALAGREHLQMTYTAALREGYLWHEFGDLHVMLP
jgi:S-adenosylmethionine:tRNA ribosyltransferase-isomerase